MTDTMLWLSTLGPNMLLVAVAVVAQVLGARTLRRSGAAGAALIGAGALLYVRVAARLFLPVLLSSDLLNSAPVAYFPLVLWGTNALLVASDAAVFALLVFAVFVERPAPSTALQPA